MKTPFPKVFALSMALTLSMLVAGGCDGGTKERAVFAQNMTDPAQGFVATTSGPANEILVMQLPGPVPSSPEQLIREERLRQLRKRGFTRVEVRGSDGKVIWEQNID